MAAVTALVCFIKRKCQLLFMEMGGQETVPANEFAVYADELAEIVKLGGLNCLTAIDARGDMPIRRAALFYDFLGAVLEKVVKNQFNNALVNMLSEDGRMELRIMLPREALGFDTFEELHYAAQAENGTFELLDLHDRAGLILSFPEGGGPDA